MTGTIKWFKPDKGFGFALGEDGKEYFCHFSDILMRGFRTLKEGQKIEFEPVNSDRGPKAMNITIL
jgi:CspA family cold shock protein